MSMPPPPPGFQAGGMPQMGGYPVAGPEYASWVDRLLAYLLDALLIIPVYIVAFILALIPKIGGLLFLVGYLAVLGLFLYLQFITGKTGASPGKRVMGIQVISEQTGQFIGGGMGIVRWLAHIIDSLVCYIGWFLPLFDAKKQTIADKVMKTIVVKGPKMSFGDAVKSIIPAK